MEKNDRDCNIGIFTSTSIFLLWLGKSPICNIDMRNIDMFNIDKCNINKRDINMCNIDIHIIDMCKGVLANHVVLL